MSYKESKKQIEEIRSQDEILFRMAISHLMIVGIKHLTAENIEEACKSIMNEDDSHSFMTNGFKCAIVRAAGKLAEVPHIDLLVYIQREVVYDVFDNAIVYPRAIDLLGKCMGQIEANENYNSKEILNVFEFLGFTDDEMSEFGFDHLLEEEE